MTGKVLFIFPIVGCLLVEIGGEIWTKGQKNDGPADYRHRKSIQSEEVTNLITPKDIPVHILYNDNTDQLWVFSSDRLNYL